MVGILGIFTVIVPFLAGMYHDFFYPYADHPYKEEKFFVFMHKMMLVGTLIAITGFFATGYHAVIDGTTTTIIMIALVNIVAGYDILIRLRPYGPWRYARLRAYFRYEKQLKQNNKST